jgi:uncharacterized membrane protein YqiK
MGYIGYMIVGIAVIGVLAVLVWILIVVRTGRGAALSRKRGPTRTGSSEGARGPVVGGMIRGGPAQVNPTRLPPQGTQAEDDETANDATRRDRESD